MTHPTSTEERLAHQEVNVAKWAIGAFVVTSVVIVAAWPLLSSEVQPGFPLAERAVPQSDGSFLLTLDVASRERWVPVHLGQGMVVDLEGDADLLLRRYVIRAPAGAKNLGSVPLEQADPHTGGSWVRDERADGDWKNAAIDRWYDYSMSNHLLTAKGYTYAIKRRAGGTATLRVESYYCDPPGSGCMTLRYRLGP